MIILLLILILARPFISSLAFPYLNYIHTACLMLVLAAWVAIKKVDSQKLKSLGSPLALFYFALFLSLMFSLYKLNSFQELYKYASGLLLFMVAASLGRRDRQGAIRVILVSGIVVSLLAIYQYFLGFRHVSEFILRHRISDPFVLDYLSRKRVFFPFVTPNTLAGFLIMVIPLAFTAKFRLLLIAPLIFALFLTKSLGAFFSLFLGMTVFFSLRGKLEKKGIIILSGLFVILGLLLLARIATPKQYIHPAFSAVMRLSYWQQALRIIRAYPLTGIGLGNFDIPLSRYAHNSYLEIWAEMGILGLISFIWLAGATLKSGIKKIKEQEYACLVTSAIVFLTHNLIDFTFFLPEVSLIWWVILGLAF